MHVKINPTRSDDITSNIQSLQCQLTRDFITECGNTIADERNIRRSVNAVGGIEYGTAFQEQIISESACLTQSKLIRIIGGVIAGEHHLL
jgi:hypothetical protein